MHAFVSYNHLDSDTATMLATQLRLAGADVWIDAWEIEPGDSVPGKVNEALAVVDTVVVVWSANAARSRWVGAELETALTRSLEEESVRVVPARLDSTELPAMLRRLSWLRIDEPGDVQTAASKLLNIGSPVELVKAIQRTLEESGLRYEYFFGYGPAVGCPKCGAPADDLRQWEQTDYERDDRYAGVECTKCGWNEGGEVL